MGSPMILRYSLVILLAAACGLSPTLANAKQRSAKDQALYEKAQKECNGPQWPGGSRIMISYSGGWYRCESLSDR